MQLLACGRSPPPAASSPSHAPDVPASAPAEATGDADARRLEELAFRFGVDPPKGRDASAADLRARVDRYRAFATAATRDPRFHAVFAPKLLSFMTLQNGVKVAPITLKTERTDDGTPYYTTSGPCPKKALVSVRPWWKTDGPVLVCKDSLRLEVERDPTTSAYCEVQNFGPARSPCRCGPHLYNCVRAEDKQALEAATLDEIVWTLGEVMSRRKASALVTMPETVRNGYGEFFYRRSRFYRTGDLQQLDVKGDTEARLRPRDPEFGGGILTAPKTLYYDNSRRPIVAQLYEDLLCTPLTAIAIDTHTLMRVSGPDLRRNANDRLVSTPGCQTCHAKLENGLQALGGFPDGTLGMRFDPSVHNPKPVMKFFVLDHNDLRSEGPATPAFLGQEIARQPEFSRCLLRKVESFVYGGYSVPDEVHGFLEKRFRDHESLGQLIEEATVARAIGVDALPVLASVTRSP